MAEHARMRAESAGASSRASVTYGETQSVERHPIQQHTREQRKAAQRAAREAQAQHKQQLFHAAMERKRAAEAEAREAAFQQLLGDVLGGLTAPAAALAAPSAAPAAGHGSTPGSSSILSKVDTVLLQHESAHAARRAALHQQWSSQVFDVIQRRVQAAVAARSVAETEAALAAASDAYLRTVATKRVFLDVVLADEFDALAPLQRCIRVATGDVVDPLLHDLLKAQAEQQLLCPSGSGNALRGRGGKMWQSGLRSTTTSSSNRASARSGSAGSTRSSVPAAGQQKMQQQPGATRYGLLASVTRPTLDTKCWAAGRIHATPYGHCINDCTGEYVIRPAASQSLAQKASRVWFDDLSML